MTKEREKIYSKFNGKCAYCGEELNGKFQVDHIIPKKNFRDVVHNGKAPEFLRHLTVNDMNHSDNLFPSCSQCNFYKDAHTLDYFRHKIGVILKNLQDCVYIYRVALKYKLIEENSINVNFHYEFHIPEAKKAMETRLAKRSDT